jgi:hypothetical protein
MLLVALVLERTVLLRLDQLGAGGVENVAGGFLDLRRELVEFRTASGGATPLELEALELVDLVQQPSGRGAEAIIGGRHAVVPLPPSKCVPQPPVRARTSEIADAFPATAYAQREHIGTVKARVSSVMTVRHRGAWRSLRDGVDVRGTLVF